MKVLALAQMTFFESIRQPSGLVISILLTVLMFISPAFSFFNMTEGMDLLRTNLLSTMMMGGVVYISMTATSLIYKELGSGTILSVLSKPISITLYYLSKCLGIFIAIVMFFTILMTSAIMSMLIGTPDTASSEINYLPVYMMMGGLGGLFLLSLALNYLIGTHLTGLMFLLWGISSPLMLVLVIWLSPLLGYRLPALGDILEYTKAASMLFLMMLVICSFAIALSSCTGPISNLVLCLGFLMVGLMAPGLQDSLVNHMPVWINELMSWLPNFHLFWMADLIGLDKDIPLAYMFDTLLYALSLIIGFTMMGVYILLQKDYS